MAPPLCPRCGQMEKGRHACSGSTKPTDDSRISARRKERLAANPMTTIEVTWKTKDQLSIIREEMASNVGKSRVIYDEVIENLLGYYRKAMSNIDTE